MEGFGTTDFDNNSRLITLSAIIISGLHCVCVYIYIYIYRWRRLWYSSVCSAQMGLWRLYTCTAEDVWVVVFIFVPKSLKRQVMSVSLSSCWYLLTLGIECGGERWSACVVVKGKVKVQPRTGHEDPKGEYRYSSTLFLTSALDGGGWSTPRPGRFTPGKDPVPIV